MKQILKFRWNNGMPKLILNTEENLVLDGKISLKLGNKHCIGYVINNIRYECLKSTNNFNALCPSCQKKDMFYSCIKCDGSRCINPNMREKCKKTLYHIYIAMIGVIPKVGISAAFRIKERLIEQGADFGAIIMSIVDGKEARKLEQRLSKYLNIADKVNSKRKVLSLLSNVNECIANLNKIISKLKFSGLISDFEIYDFRKHYSLENIWEQPIKINIKPNTVIKGKVVATKGNIIVIENRQKLYSFDAQHLVGYEIKEI